MPNKEMQRKSAYETHSFNWHFSWLYDLLGGGQDKNYSLVVVTTIIVAK